MTLNTLICVVTVLTTIKESLFPAPREKTIEFIDVYTYGKDKSSFKPPKSNIEEWWLLNFLQMIEKLHQFISMWLWWRRLWGSKAHAYLWTTKVPHALYCMLAWTCAIPTRCNRAHELTFQMNPTPYTHTIICSPYSKSPPPHLHPHDLPPCPYGALQEEKKDFLSSFLKQTFHMFVTNFHTNNYQSKPCVGELGLFSL